MRPLELELEGFTAFAGRTRVDFRDVDLFVLWGATGSGKSSLIDAMTFALYGSVPRYRDPKLVAPAISQGRSEARVRFDFSVGGREYTAVRVVRRVKRGDGWGASTREARLETGGEVLAGSARELDEKIRELLGLSFEQFTTCVVLPQGEFARFLHERAADRQDLLKELLQLKVYGRMGSVARSREAAAKQRAGFIEEQLEQLGGTGEQALTEAEARVAQLAQLKLLAETVEAAIAGLARERDEKQAEVIRLHRVVDTLKRVEVPGDVPELSVSQERAGSELERAVGARERAEADLARAEAALAALPSADPVKALLRDREERAKEHLEHEAARERATQATDLAARHEADLQQARATLEQARGRVEAIGRAHAAHALAQGLAAGQPCPVCHRALESPPQHAEPPGHAEAEAAVRSAGERLQDCERVHREAAGEAVRAGERVKTHAERIAVLDERLGDAPPVADLERQLADIVAASGAVDAARKSADAARRAEREAMAGRDLVARQVETAWAHHASARDAVAAHDPPPPDRADLAGSWRTLAEWSRVHTERYSHQAQDLATQVASLDGQIAGQTAEFTAACREADLDLDEGERPSSAVAAAVAHAQNAVAVIRRDLDRQAELSAERERVDESAAVAAALARHLRADGFERWLLEEAFEQLVAGASRTLRELSSGNYSFAMDDRLGDFEVIDHRNADERRSARTLSGGETFLASLALALTLAEQIADLAADGAARLESMFLDEGFGTLDADTLDTVATTIEELGARGRTVGLVTHVPALAERIPVQYHVTRGPASASVEKVLT